MIKRISAALMAALMLIFTAVPALAESTPAALFVTVTGEGTVSPGNGVYQTGDAVTFNLRAGTGYVLSKLTVNGTEVQVENNRYTHTMETTTMVEAVFVPGVKITVTQPAGGKITPAGTNSVLYVKPDSSCEFTFTADTGYKLQSLKLNGVSFPYTQVDGVAKYTLDVEGADMSYSVSAVYEEVKLCNVTFNVSGFGSVIPAPVDNKLAVEEGTDLVFSLLPDEGNGVSSVMLGDTALVPDAEGKYTVPAVSEDKTVTVTFAERKLCDVIVTYTEGGTVTPETSQVLEGETLVFTLMPDEGYEIESLTVNGIVTEISEDNTASVLIQGNTTVIATFKATVPMHLITAYVKNNVGGTITAEGDYVIEQMKVYVQDGESITFTFTPDLDYEITNVKVDARDVQITNNSFTFPAVTEPHNIVVTFSIVEEPVTTVYSVKPYSGSNGSISPSIEQKLEAGKSVTFTFTPDAGYEINYVMVDNVDVSVTDGKYTINNISANHTIEVYFKKKPVVVKETVTVDDIDWTADTLLIDITNYKKVDSAVFDKIRTDYPNVPYKVTCSEYEWLFPAGNKLFPLSSTVDFTVTVNGGAQYSDIKQLVTERLSESGLAGLETVILTTSLNATTELGATLKIKLAELAGMKLDYLEPDLEEETIKSIIRNINKTLPESERFKDITVTADASGNVELLFNNTKSIVLVRAPEGTYMVSATCGDGGSVSPRGDYRVSTGKDVTYLFQANLGYVIDTVTVDGVAIAELSGKTEANYVLEQVINEHTVEVTYKPQTTVSTPTESTASNPEESTASEDNEGGKGKTILIAIIIVAISLIGAGVLFIYKWQQEKDIID